MLLVTGPGPEFIRFMQILSWIFIPVLFIVVGLTIFFHYRRKKNAVADSADKPTEEEFIAASPEQVGYTTGDGDYVLFDHSSLIQEYKKRLSYHHAKYSALQHDFGKLESKYSLLINYADFSFNSSKNIKKKIMENQDTIQELQPVAEESYLRDMLEEKKAQIEFLQSQLELRIRQQHQAEQQRLQLAAEISDVKNYAHTVNEEMSGLRNDLLGKQDEADRLQVIVCEKEELLALGQRQLQEKSDQVVYLENQAAELKERNELLRAESADLQDRGVVMEQQLEDKATRIEYLEGKVHGTRQQIRRLFKEFSDLADQESDKSPVIALHEESIVGSSEFGARSQNL